MVKFNVLDLDRKLWKKLAYKEADGIYAHPSRARGRSLEEIRATCLMGKAAEVYLMTKCGFKNDPEYCKDLLDLNNIPVEIKTTRKKHYVQYVLKRANEAALESFRKYQKVLYIFVVNVYNGDYELAGIYNWNGKEFVNA